MSNSVCVLINSCPKYNHLAVFSCCLIRRYAASLAWPIYLATADLRQEEHAMLMAAGVKVIEQGPENTDFIESRIEALRLLQREFSFILLLQDDFFLDRTPDYNALQSTITMMSQNKEVVCTRLMPCPEPTGPNFGKIWQCIAVDPYCYFSFQATIWSLPWLLRFFEGVFRKSQDLFTKYSQFSRNQFWLLINPCEKQVGTEVAVELGGNFVGFSRKGPWSNAVYLSPWPYRPTAVERGVLQPWAIEMIKREGF
jgi:hypothetical protein